MIFVLQCLYTTVLSYITRLPKCKYSANFTQIHQGKYFEGPIGRTITGHENRDDCSTYCLSFKTCLFYNYKVDESACKLLTSHMGTLVEKVGWRYVTTDYTKYLHQSPFCEFLEVSCGEDGDIETSVCQDSCVSAVRM